MPKVFRLSKEQINSLAEGYGSCFATDMITVEGYPIRFMYREDPDNEIDSGWRFMSGFESDDYMENPENHAIYDVNTISNYDQSIIPLLNSPVGSAYEKAEESDIFTLVTDWGPPTE